MDYAGFVVPEMVKRRPVIVISPKPRREQGLCAVVPLSTTAPRTVEKHHIDIILPDEFIKDGKFTKNCWAKCDIVNTISLARLDLVRIGKNTDGKRIYSYFRVSSDTLEAIRKAVFSCIGGKI